ncbi:ABC transporter ATP-binding protein [Clostridia bacterium]|nr:ABC transporter ATP-binding protein [Clostridia bacterium]
MIMFCSLCDISYPLFLKYAIEHFIVPRTLDGIVPFVLLLFGAFVLTGISVRTFVRLSSQVELGIGHDLRRAVFVHLQTLPFAYYNKTPVGYMMARTMSDTNTIGERFAWGIIDTLWSGSFIIFAFVSMFLLAPSLALVVAVILPLIAGAGLFFQVRILRANRAARKVNSKMTGAMNEGITGAKTTKTLVIEDKIYGEFTHITSDLKKRMTTTGKLRSIYYPLVYFIGALSTAIILGFTGSGVLASSVIPVGTLAAFIVYTLDIHNPIQQFTNNMVEFVSVQANIERVFGLLAIEPEIADSPEIIEKYGGSFDGKRENWEDIKGDIEFSDVTFHYPDTDVNIFEHLNLEIPAGSCTAIVGETGAGKSTLVNLICRFFEPSGGKILIDGKDIRERSQLWLRSRLGYVLQNPHLFSGSVRENIRYGRLDASDDEVEAAAKQISADALIETLENKWDTNAGEGGDRLSVGQKQMISLARAVLADPRIFILDEATSSVDAETEKLIQDAIDSLLHGRTSFVIAHRLSTIKRADLILVVDDGKIVERGTHNELMQMRGRYHSLYTRQFEDEIKI